MNTWLRNKSIAFIAISCAAMAILSISLVSAQDDFNVIIGQDKTFTSFNYFNHWLSDDPNNPLPWPDNPIATANGNTAYVSLTATPGHAGQATAEVGVKINWDLGSHSWDEVANWPVKSGLITLMILALIGKNPMVLPMPSFIYQIHQNTWRG